MATASTLTAIRRQVIRELDLGFVIINTHIGALAAASVTSTRWFANTDFGPSHFSGMGYGFFRMAAATAADNYRPAGTLTAATGVLTQTGANWSDTTSTSEDIEMVKGRLRPEDFVDAINEAMTEIYTSTFVPFSDLSNVDGDMFASTDTNWTDVGTPNTSAKSQTARRTPWGLRSYRILNDGANEGTQSATLPMRQLRNVRGFTISSADVGSSQFQYYDVTGSAAFGTAITHSEEEPQLVCLASTTIPTSCKEVALQGIGTTSTTDIYYNGMWLYRGNRRVELPAYVAENFQAPTIQQARPLTTGANGVYDALNLEMVKLVKGVDYNPISNQPEANPHAIQFLNDQCFDWPLFVEARLPYSYFGALSAEADTTTCPLNLIVPRAKLKLIDNVLINRAPFKGDATVVAQRAIAVDEWNKAIASRPVQIVAKAMPYFATPRL